MTQVTETKDTISEDLSNFEQLLLAYFKKVGKSSLDLDSKDSAKLKSGKKITNGLFENHLDYIDLSKLTPKKTRDLSATIDSQVIRKFPSLGLDPDVN